MHVEFLELFGNLQFFFSIYAFHRSVYVRQSSTSYSMLALSVAVVMCYAKAIPADLPWIQSSLIQKTIMGVLNVKTTI